VILGDYMWDWGCGGCWSWRGSGKEEMGEDLLGIVMFKLWFGGLLAAYLYRDMYGMLRHAFW
jgi:hypothetical protein